MGTGCLLVRQHAVAGPVSRGRPHAGAAGLVIGSLKVVSVLLGRRKTKTFLAGTIEKVSQKSENDKQK